MTHLTSETSGSSFTLLFRNDELFLHEEDLSLLTDEECVLLQIPSSRFHTVTAIHDHTYRVGWVDPEFTPPPSIIAKPLRSLLGTHDEFFLSIAGRAFQISEWARTHQYCGVCASPMDQVEGERCMRCLRCRFSAYPRISPVVMVMIQRGDKILLAKHATYRSTRYTVLAGFVEAGETVEQAIHREVHEEVGLHVTDLRYFGSQSWPFPHSLMLAFVAQYSEGEITPDPHEIADAQWFGPTDTLPEIPSEYAISGKLIRSHFASLQLRTL